MVLRIALESRFNVAMRRRLAQDFADGRKEIYDKIVRLAPRETDDGRWRDRTGTDERQQKEQHAPMHPWCGWYSLKKITGT
jgi:hypothetical protein